MSDACSNGIVALWNVVATMLSDGGSNCAKEYGSYHVSGMW